MLHVLETLGSLSTHVQRPLCYDLYLRGRWHVQQCVWASAAKHAAKAA